MLSVMANTLSSRVGEIAGPGEVITIGNITEAALQHVKGFMLSSVPVAWKSKKQGGMWKMASQAIPLLPSWIMVATACWLIFHPNKLALL